MERVYRPLRVAVYGMGVALDQASILFILTSFILPTPITRRRITVMGQRLRQTRRVLLVLACVSPAWGEEPAAGPPTAPTPDAVWKSIQTQRKNASESVIPKNMALEYTIEQHYPIEPAELAALKAKVEGKPDHPARQDIRMYEEYLRNGPRRNIVQIWITVDGLCRYSVNYPYSTAIPFTDSAIGRETSWMLSPTLLTISDSSGTSAPPERNTTIMPSGGRREAADILYGPFWFYSTVAADNNDFRVDANHWTLILDGTKMGGGVARMKGYWDENTGVALATETVVVDESGSSGSLIAIRAEKWSYSEPLEMWIPTMVESDSGRHKYRVALVRSAAAVATQEVETLTATPTIDHPDPVRGELTVESVYDYRSGSNSDIPLIAQGLAQTQASTGMISLRVIQWAAYGAAAALAAIMVAMRVHATRRQHI